MIGAYFLGNKDEYTIETFIPNPDPHLTSDEGQERTGG